MSSEEYKGTPPQPVDASLNKSPILTNTPRVESILASFSTTFERVLSEEKKDQGIAAYTFSYISNEKKIGGYLVVQEKLLQSNDPLPVIINNRGGAKDYGVIEKKELFGFVGRGLAQKMPCIVIGSQYPGNKYSEGKDTWGGEEDITAIDDLFPLVDHFRQGLPVVMFGWSRGGNVAARYLTTSPFAKKLKAVVIIAINANLFETVKKVPDMIKTFTEAFGMTEEGMKARSALYCPGKFPDKTPVLMLQGGMDKRVPPLESQRLYEELIKLGKPVTYLYFKDADHHLIENKDTPEERKIDWATIVKDWLTPYLFTTIEHE